MHRATLLACAVGILAFAVNVQAQQAPPPRGKDAPETTLDGYSKVLQVDLDNDGDSLIDGTATITNAALDVNPITGGRNRVYDGNSYDPNTGTGYYMQPGWTSWLLFDGNSPPSSYDTWKNNAALQNGVIDRVFTTSAGDVHVSLDAVGFTGTPGTPGGVLNGRGRAIEIDTDDDGIPDTPVPAPSSGANAELYMDAVYSDFYLVARDEAWAMGRHFLEIKFDVSDILNDDVNGWGENTGFELSMYAYDPGQPSTFGQQAWASGTTLGGLNPSDWLDTNWNFTEDDPATTDVDESTVAPDRGYEVMYFGATRDTNRHDGYRDEFGAFPGTYRNPMLDGVDEPGTQYVTPNNLELTAGDPNTGTGLFRTPISGPWPVTNMAVPQNGVTYTLDDDNNWNGDLDGDNIADYLDDDADGDSIIDRDIDGNLVDLDSDNDGFDDVDGVDTDGWPGFYDGGPLTGNPDPANHDPDMDNDADASFTHQYPTSPWRYAMISNFTPDENGIITIYTWADGDAFNGVAQLAVILNGFEIALFNMEEECFLGDTDGDLDVDSDDLINVKNHFGEVGPGSLGDADCDGDTDSDDLIAVKNLFGTVYTPGLAVPEPASLALLAIGGLALMRRKVRKNHVKT